MRDASSEQRDLASWLLAREAGGGRSPEELAEGAERACDKLYGRLSRLLGPDGVVALFERGLSRAKAEFPFLEGVEVASPASDCLKGLRESVKGVDAEVAEMGLTTTLANWIWLLSSFIGDELALRQLHGIWPDVPNRGPGPEEATR